ncbi:MAG: DMT family transporter [Bacilli bacterium]|jgi:drug/metabolite transporter (DMT)-like permease|nr:DMT family transporter [Bacilli bacterium]
MKKLAHLSGIAFSSIFGLSFLFSKIALNYIQPITLIAFRFLLAFLVIEILRLLKIIRIQFSKNKLKAILPIVLFQPILYFLFETYGLQLVASSEAGMMIALIPIMVSIFSILILKEKPSALQFLYILLSVGGIIFIQWMKSTAGLFQNGWGIVLLFGAVLAAALFNIASRKANEQVTPIEITYFMMLFGAIIFQTVYIVMLLGEGNISGYGRDLANLSVIGPILYLGIIASIGGFFLVNFSLHHLSAPVSSIYSNLATVVSIIAGAVFLQERLDYYHYIGAAMIIFGVYQTARLGNKKKQVS